MSTVKISELPEITHYSTNTEATLVVGVDLSTGTTGKSTLTTLGEGLYAYQPLKVGENQVLFANTMGQFSGNSNTFLQINNQNFSSLGSSDYVASTSDSDNLSKYIDMGINGSSFSNAIYSSMKPYDGYLYVYGPSPLSASGNLVVGTASSFANIVYIVGGTTTSNIVARMTKTDLQLSANYNLKFGDGSVQSVAASPANYIQSAYNTANNALANTTGSFAGSLNILNNLTVNGTIVLANTNFATTEAAFRITAAGSSQTPTQAGTLIQLTGKANTPTRMLLDSFGATQNTAYSIIAGRSARGTVNIPTATQNNDILLRIAGNSYGTTGYAPLGVARIDFVAAENQSDTARGSRIVFYNTPVGSNVVNQIASFNASTVEFTGSVNPTKGFIHTSLVYPSAQTAITIDFANNSMVRAQTSTGIVVSMNNYTVGKVVELWITNLAGSNQTYTTGVPAINSTLNATTYNIPSTSTICARYFCIDGTLANTLVSVIHA